MLLSFWTSETTQALRPLRPTGGKAPLERFEDADLESAVSSLRRLRLLASCLEAELRQLQRWMNPTDLPLN